MHKSTDRTFWVLHLAAVALCSFVLGCWYGHEPEKPLPNRQFVSSQVSPYAAVLWGENYPVLRPMVRRALNDGFLSEAEVEEIRIAVVHEAEKQDWKESDRRMSKWEDEPS